MNTYNAAMEAFREVAGTTMDTAADAIIESNYAYYGVRMLSKINKTDQIPELAVGDVAPVSREWDDNELTGELMDGTSALCLNQWSDDLCAEIEARVAALATYGPGTVVILGSDCVTTGIDKGEIVMRKACVLAVIA